MKRKKWKDLLSSSLATGGVFAFSGAMFLLCRFSQYRLLHLAGIFLLMLGGVNLILLLFGKDPVPPTTDRFKRAEAEDSVSKENAEASYAEADEETQNNGKKREIGKEAFRLLDICGTHLEIFYCRIFRAVEILLLAAVCAGAFIWFGASAQSTLPSAKLAYWQLAVIGLLFVLAVVGDNLCKHYDAEDERYAMLMRNACIFFKLTKLALVLIAAPMTLSLLNIYDIQKYVIYVFIALFYYVGIMIVVSLAVRAFRKELDTAPGVVVLLPFMGADAKELSIISFLEDNTGITLRSLWSIKYVRQILPYTVICAALLFWVSTGIVYVQSHQQAAVFRLGVLQEETLEPGLHLTLPYPFDQREIYDTETVSKMTIGYSSTEDRDNTWTQSHGENEYELLLGSGKELVSINLRIQYKISDLKQYVRTSSAPEKILESKAYELITDRTICTDLDTLLATDRETFASSLADSLRSETQRTGIGLDVVSVVLESIHPPVEVADVYEKFIAAEIDAERYILEAEGDAASIVAMAETAKHSIVNAAKVDYYDKIGKATIEISEFMAAVNASNEYPDEYKYYKYLEAITEAYGNSRLVIVGNDVDSGRLYFGNFKPNS